jgi:peptide/nickel transport system substrate-binding protein
VIRPAAFALAGTILFAACAAPQPAASLVPSGRSGGTVVFAWQDPTTLDPLRSTGAQTSALIYGVAVEGLLRAGPDGEPVPVLARDVPSLANGGVKLETGGMTVRYALRDDVRWSDGEPFTSEDVRFTWRAIVTDPKVASREGYDQIETVDTPDARTAVVRYRSIYPAYVTRFDAILPKHRLDGASEAVRADYGRTPLGTGPFRITELVAGSHATAERNPLYRIAGRPYLDRIVFRFVPSIDAAKAQLVAGEVQVAVSVGEVEAAELAEKGIVVETSSSPVVEALSFNLARPGDPADAAVPHPVLGDLAVRKALLLATPKRDIVERLLLGRANVGTSEIPLGRWASKDLRQDARDPEAAKRLLDSAGWIVGPDGVRAKDGVRASLRIVGTTGNAVRERVEQVLVDAWKAVGVEAVIRNVPPAVLTAAWSSKGTRKRGDFDVLIAQLGLGTVGGTEPFGYLSQRHRCANIPRNENNGAGANYERFCDARVDEALDRAGRTMDAAVQDAAYRDVLRIVNEQVVAVWLYDRSRNHAYAPAVVGHKPNPWDLPTWNIEEWSLR